jgi:hypothetical protein
MVDLSAALGHLPDFDNTEASKILRDFVSMNL